MGFSKNIYIGPYIVVKDKTVETKVTEKYHPNTNVRFKDHLNFCPDTGIKLEVRTKTVPEKKSFRWFSEPLKEDCFYCPPYPELNGKTVHILSSRSKVTYSNDDTFVHDLTDHDIYEIMADFKVKFEEYLKYLNDNQWDFSIHYGVVHYAS
jgi:hypothetical protein